VTGALRTLDDLDPADKRVLVRVDINVPLDAGQVTDATRIRRVAPTLGELAAKGGRVVVLSHLGRPKGQRIASLSLAPLVAPLCEALGGRPIGFAEDCIGPAAEAAVAALGPGEIVLLENLRFHPGETKNDPAFVDALAALGDAFVNDAFAAAHRAHASVVGLAERLPAYAGRLMQAELEALDKALGHPERPVCAIVGGAKVSTKLGLLTHLIDKVDVLVVGGAMANTFLLARGVAIGRSLAEREMTAKARDILARAEAAGCTVELPLDGVTATEFATGAPHRTVAIGAVAEDAMILDIGPRTVARLGARLAEMRTVVWNGPLGAFELEGFADGTVAVARAVARLTGEGRLISVAGGGDTVAALAQAGVIDDFTYVSTAGGAFLEWLEGKALPGVAVLEV